MTYRCSPLGTPRLSSGIARPQQGVPRQRLPDLGENRREALRIAAGFRGEEAFEAGVGEDEALDAVLPWLSEERCVQLAGECLELYCWDRLGSEN